jgi:glycosyltransferase involved in cell wall biosynthesis
MISQKKISLCLPCRNEGPHLRQVIKLVPNYIDEILIISNASTDNTLEIAQGMEGKVIALEDNRTVDGVGYGFAHITGISHASGDIIIGADGDATYPFQDIANIVNSLIKDNLDFISCNRYPLKEGTNIPFKLRFGVTLLNWEIRLLYGFKIKDALSGMWIFRKEISDELHLTMGEWNLSPQIKINAATNPAIRFGEYSIAQHQRMGETKQHYFKTGLKHAFWIFTNSVSGQWKQP